MPTADHDNLPVPVDRVRSAQLYVPKNLVQIDETDEVVELRHPATETAVEAVSAAADDLDSTTQANELGPQVSLPESAAAVTPAAALLTAAGFAPLRQAVTAALKPIALDVMQSQIGTFSTPLLRTNIGGASNYLDVLAGSASSPKVIEAVSRHWLPQTDWASIVWKGVPLPDLYSGDLLHPALAAEMVLPNINTFAHDLVSDVIGDAIRVPLAAMLDQWRDLAKVDFGPANLALRAARAARAAFLNAQEGWRDVVLRFARIWLEIKGRIDDATLDAVVAVLLDEHLLESTDDTEHRLRRAYDVERRRHRPIWETRLNRSNIGSLNRQLWLPGGEQVELSALVQAPDTITAGWVPDDPRTATLLNGLRLDEQAVVKARYATSDPGMTWEDAAAVCGYSPQVGERARRKLNRHAMKGVQR